MTKCCLSCRPPVTPCGRCTRWADPERSDGCNFLILWFPHGVAASLWPAVAAAGVRIGPDVVASLPLLPLFCWVSFLVRTRGYMELLVVSWHPILVLRYSSGVWILVSVMATPAPTSAPSMAPAMI